MLIPEEQMIFIIVIIAILLLSKSTPGGGKMLSVQILKKGLTEAYTKKRNHASDCGFDCYSEPVVVPAMARAFPVPLGIAAAPSIGKGFMLVPRSSITKTPLRLSNSMGIIDPDYRGEIQARVDNLSNNIFEIDGQSLFQLVWGDLSPMKVQFVDSLPETARGSGGFGSTGN